MRDIKKVIIAKAKLSGKETGIEIHCMLNSHFALIENGFISNSVITDTNGNPEYIESIWEVSKYDNGKLCKGQRYGYITI